MIITRNLLRNLFVLLIVLFCAILVIQSIDNVLAINVYIILHLMLMGGVLVAFTWVDWKETRKQFRERCQKMDEELEKARLEAAEKFSQESQAFWLKVAAENEARAEDEARAAAVPSVPVSVPVRPTTLVPSIKRSVYGPVPRTGGSPESMYPTSPVYGPIKRPR